MIFYLIAVIVVPLIMMALYCHRALKAFPNLTSVAGGILWLAEFQAMYRIIEVLKPSLKNDVMNATLISFIISIVIWILVMLYSCAYRRIVLKERNKAIDKIVRETLNDWVNAAKLNSPAPVSQPELATIPHITEITEPGCVVNGILYLGHIGVTLDDILASADALPQRNGDATNVAYSNGKYVYMYMNKQWFYAGVSVFLHKPNMFSNPQAWIEDRTIRNFKCFDTSSMGPLFSEYVSHLANRPEMPSSEDLYEHLRDDFASQLQLSEAIDIFNERIKTLVMTLSKASNSEVITLFKSIANFPNTNVRAKVIRAEAEKRSEQMQKDDNTSEPFNDFPLTSTAKE